MKHFAWLTDIHLDFLGETDRSAFYEELTAESVDGYFINGDIGNSKIVVDCLSSLANTVARPVYFVLGNHDFYQSSFDSVEAEIRTLCEINDWLSWLTDSQMITLTPNTALIGHDGWADGRIGNFAKSTVMLNDYVLIEELREAHACGRLAEMLAQRGDQAAETVRDRLTAAAGDHDSIVCLTHVPPFLEACLYDGLPSDDDWAPHFSCKAMGDVLFDFATSHPDHRLSVYCGHTHAPAEVDILPNLHVCAGEAEYCFPIIQRIVEVQ